MLPIEILKKPYNRIIHKEDDDGSVQFSGTILEFPGCFAVGDTLQAVWENLENTAIAWLEVSIEFKHKIPEPLNLAETQKKLDLYNTLGVTREDFKMEVLGDAD